LTNRTKQRSVFSSSRPPPKTTQAGGFHDKADAGPDCPVRTAPEGRGRPRRVRRQAQRVLPGQGRGRWRHRGPHRDTGSARRADPGQPDRRRHGRAGRSHRRARGRSRRSRSARRARRSARRGRRRRSARRRSRRSRSARRARRSARARGHRGHRRRVGPSGLKDHQPSAEWRSNATCSDYTRK